MANKNNRQGESEGPIMAKTNAKLNWVCQDCELFAHGDADFSGSVYGMIHSGKDLGPLVEGLAITENDWSHNRLFRKGLIDLELTKLKLKAHHGHRVTILLTGERLAQWQRRIGMIPDE
jgi:hypothetical protein